MSFLSFEDYPVAEPDNVELTVAKSIFDETSAELPCATGDCPISPYITQEVCAERLRSLQLLPHVQDGGLIMDEVICPPAYLDSFVASIKRRQQGAA
jgi:hypothetical protein